MIQSLGTREVKAQWQPVAVAVIITIQPVVAAPILEQEAEEGTILQLALAEVIILVLEAMHLVPVLPDCLWGAVAVPAMETILQKPVVAVEMVAESFS